MKVILATIMIIICFLSSSFATVNDKIVSYYKQKRFINFEEVLLTPIEFIELCKDTTEMRKLDEGLITLRKIHSMRTKPEVEEDKLLISMVKNEVIGANVEDSLSYLIQQAIIQKLETFSVETKIDSDFIYSRLSAKESVEQCNKCISMYIFFFYDPKLYSQVIHEHEDLFPYKIYFPLNMIQDRFAPMDFLELRKNRVLSIVESSKDPIMKEIYTQVLNCDITDRGN
jgi:hypothetical protein